MAFWISKKSKNDQDGNTDPNSPQNKKKKDDKKQQAAKRIDNLRIPQNLHVVVKSLGTQNEFISNTKDLSATGAFVLCENFKNLPFIQASTLLDCEVDFTSENQQTSKLKFFAKIARIVEGKETGPDNQPGFGIKIVQISLEQKNMLENFIAKHGAPEYLNSQDNPESSEYVLENSKDEVEVPKVEKAI